MLHQFFVSIFDDAEFQLGKWAEEWLMKFNVDMFKVLHFGVKRGQDLHSKSKWQSLGSGVEQRAGSEK